MIEEQGVVVAVHGNSIEVELQQQSSCGSCQAKKACGTQLVTSLFPSRQHRLTFDNTIDARLGDAVVLAIEEKQVVSGSLQFYLLPLLGLIGGALLFDFIAPHIGISQELMQITGGLLGMTVVLFEIRRRNRHLLSAHIQVRHVVDVGHGINISLNHSER